MNSSFIIQCEICEDGVYADVLESYQTIYVVKSASNSVVSYRPWQ